MLLLDDLAVDDCVVLELAWRDTSSVQELDVGVSPVLGLGL